MLMTLSEDYLVYDQAVAVIRRRILANPQPQTPEGLSRQLHASSRHDALDELAGLAMPVHVIGAEHDVLVPVWKSQELAERIPGARVSVIERAPHGVTLERAEEFNGLVLDFLREHSEAAAAA